MDILPSSFGVCIKEVQRNISLEAANTNIPYLFD